MSSSASRVSQPKRLAGETGVNGTREFRDAEGSDALLPAVTMRLCILLDCISAYKSAHFKSPNDIAKSAHAELCWRGHREIASPKQQDGCWR